MRTAEVIRHAFTEALYFSIRNGRHFVSGHFDLSSALDDKSALTFVDGE